MMTPKPVRTYSSALGSGESLAGTFYYDLASDKMLWSDELYRLHGYERGDVVPTLELLLAHKHPDDVPYSRRLWHDACTSGGQFCSYHRIIDANKREHHVLTSGEGILDAGGRVESVHGYVVDLSSTLQREVQGAAHEAVQRSSASRGVIERAIGFLMGYFRIDSETAFQLLLNRSQNTNTKLARLAGELVESAENRDYAAFLDEFALALRASNHTTKAAEVSRSGEAS
jgi:hypothetical protein